MSNLLQSLATAIVKQLLSNLLFAQSTSFADGFSTSAVVGFNAMPVQDSLDNPVLNFSET